jgi:flagellar hook-associated protein 2
VATIASFSGLASGIQWNDLIDEIIKVESRPILRLQERISLSRQRAHSWSDFESRVRQLSEAVRGLESGASLRVFRATIAGLSSGVASPLASVSAGPSATPGSHTVRVLSLAASEKLGSGVFGSRSEALGIAGELRVNGVQLRLDANDTLDSIARRINASSGGSSGSGVTASVLTTGPNQFRLILTSSKTGAAGIDLVDGATGALGQLGFTGGSATIKHATSSGAQSDAFASASTAVGALLGFASAPSGAVTIGTLAVNLDLAAMSLDDVAGEINAAASAAGKAITATVVEETVNGVTKHQLDIRGTTSFGDANHVLEALGVVRAGRDAIAQVLQGGALTAGNANTPASATTALADLWVGGAAAGAQVGDTLTLGGTRGDGSTFSIDYTIGAGDTVGDLLGRLNSAADGLQAGSRTATASISDGRITVTDAVGGTSRLSLSIVAHNEGGGRLDFGAFGASTLGIARQITAGADAEVEIDGSYFRRSANVITDAVPGLTFNFGVADPNVPVTVNVERDADAAADAIKSVVAAYNALTEFVSTQLAPPPQGGTPQPLYGDGVLRSMRSTLRLAMQATVAPGIANELTRFGDIGIELQRDGKFTVNDARLRNALATDGEAVTRLLGLHGSSDNAALSYSFATDATKPGAYAVHVTQPATAADVTGLGFSGTYVTAWPSDTLTIRDLGTGKTYTVVLTDGMSLGAVVDALKQEFATTTVHQAAAAHAMHADASGTVATESTTFADLHTTGGAPLGVAAGDEITISGTRPNGSAFLTKFIVTDPATQTLGDFRAAVQSAAGSDVDVAFDQGALTVTAKQAGASQFTLAVTSDNASGGTFSLGGFDVITEGRGATAITASDAGGQLRIAQPNYGSAHGFEISLAGSAATASLGLAEGSYSGQDVAATIGGVAATGAGQLLTGAAGSAAEGLAFSYTSSATGDAGTVTFSRGIAAAIRLTTAPFLGLGNVSISAIKQRIEGGNSRITDRISTLESRIERRREELVKRFSALEQVMTRAQSQSSWLESQLQALRPRAR